MSHKPPAHSHHLPSLIKHSALVTLVMIAAMELVQAAPVLSVVMNSPSASGTSIGPLSSDVGTHVDVNYSSTPLVTMDTARIEVITPAGPGTAGLALDYIDTTRSYSVIKETSYYDYAYANVSADNSQPLNFTNGKYIQLSGTISSTTALYLYYGISASGSYQAVNTPFGAAAPALPTFYFSSGSNPLAPTAITSSSDAGIFSSHNDGMLTLAANSSISFNAVVYAGNGVALQEFGIGFSTSNYQTDTTLTPYSSTDSRLVGGHLIPPLPVPEPATYLMLFVGLLCIGNAASHRRRTPKFK